MRGAEAPAGRGRSTHQVVELLREVLMLLVVKHRAAQRHEDEAADDHVRRHAVEAGGARHVVRQRPQHLHGHTQRESVSFGGAWLQGHDHSVGSEVLGFSSRVPRAA